MLAEFFYIGLLMLLAVMVPGPDFALVTKNSILHSRRTGIFTSLGIATAVLMHISYCILGLAVIISQSLLLFSMVKYIGASYLIYLGVSALLSKHRARSAPNVITNSLVTKTTISDLAAFRQGFLCNLLNPKATLFFLALFTVIIKPHTPIFIELAYALEMFVIVLAWFSCLTILLSHPRVLGILTKIEKYLEKTVGVFLIGFGIILVFAKKH